MKTHFLTSRESASFSGAVTLPCGVTLSHPYPVTQDAQVDILEMRGLTFCAKCSDHAYQELRKRQGNLYLYGLIEGEEAMHSGDTLEKIEQAVSKHSKFTQGIDSASDGKSEIAATENR